MPRTPALPPDSLIPGSLTRRTILKAGGTLLLSVVAPLTASAAQIMAVRVWPADEYTRVTLENDGELKTTHFMVPDPPRLVVAIFGNRKSPEYPLPFGCLVHRFPHRAAERRVLASSY